jgi:hypothetical protein
MARPPRLLLAATLGTLLAALAAGASSDFQEEAPPPQEREQPPGEVAPTYEALVAQFEALEDELREAAKAAPSKDERNALRDERKALPEYFWPRMEAAADAGEGQALLWMIQHARKAGVSKQELPATKRALYERVLADHLEADWLGEALKRLAADRRDLGTDVVIELLTQVHGSEAAALTRSEAAFLIATAYDREDGEVAEKQAVAWYNRLAEEFPDTPRAGDAKDRIFELENLQIGMVAPDIEAADLDGVDFKLSDYRGKVVVLDFWGDW